MRLLELALRVLPVDSRARYREEAQADLLHLHGPRRLGYLLAMLVTAPALRRALRRPRVGLDGHRIRLRCRLGMHHWQTYRNADNQPYRRCDRCGKDDDQVRGASAEDSMAAAMSVYRTTQ